MAGIDDDPLNDRCDACGADAAEPCRPDCVGRAAVLCTADVGGDPASGCDEFATGDDGLCDRHRAAYEMCVQDD